MTTAADLWSFALVVGLLTLTPGLDTALIVRTAAAGLPRKAWGVVLGVQCGTLTWGVLASAGVSALLTASHLAYDVLRWAGACYLVWLGMRMLWHSRRPGPGPEGAGRTAATTDRFWAGWRRGALTNLLNPKVGAFYVALLPQFIPAGAPALLFGVLLASVHVALGLTWSTVLVLAARRMHRVLQRPSLQRALDRVTGTVIAGFGVRLALSDH